MPIAGSEEWIEGFIVFKWQDEFLINEVVGTLDSVRVIFGDYRPVGVIRIRTKAERALLKMFKPDATDFFSADYRTVIFEPCDDEVEARESISASVPRAIFSKCGFGTIAFADEKTMMQFWKTWKRAASKFLDLSPRLFLR